MVVLYYPAAAAKWRTPAAPAKCASPMPCSWSPSAPAQLWRATVYPPTGIALFQAPLSKRWAWVVAAVEAFAPRCRSGWKDTLACCCHKGAAAVSIYHQLINVRWPVVAWSALRWDRHLPCFEEAIRVSVPAKAYHFRGALIIVTVKPACWFLSYWFVAHCHDKRAMISSLPAPRIPHPTQLPQPRRGYAQNRAGLRSPRCASIALPQWRAASAARWEWATARRAP